jgi:hypothetical protein
MNDGGTPLMIAVQEGHEAIVRLLVLECKVDVNQASKPGYYPLHIAVISRVARVVKVLLHAGASPNVCNNNGFSPLDLAAHVGHRKITALLLDKTDVSAAELREISDRLTPAARESLKLRQCVRCLKLAVLGQKFQKCGRCQAVRYCSRACQREAWKEHKAVCGKG